MTWRAGRGGAVPCRECAPVVFMYQRRVNESPVLLVATSSKVEIGQRPPQLPAAVAWRLLGTILSHTRRHRRLASRAPQGEAPRRRPSPSPTRTMSRPVTMNDLFADPEGCESTDDKTAKLASKAAGFERKGGSRVHIAKAAVQGEFGAKKFIKP